jgi:hypothetical protein
MQVAVAVVFLVETRQVRVGRAAVETVALLLVALVKTVLQILVAVVVVRQLYQVVTLILLAVQVVAV